MGKRDMSSTSSSSSVSTLIRLSKRMSELDLCSRREADRLLMERKVLVRGVPVSLAHKVPADETDIEILGWGDPTTSPHAFPAAVVLNKPLDYVSGQPQDGHAPAVKLLTRENAFGISKQDQLEALYQSVRDVTLRGYAPAGRLDMDSTGLLVFCQSGVLAKKLVSAVGLVEKEYLVQLEVAKQITVPEQFMGMKKLPPPNLDLSLFRKGGGFLLGDKRPLRPAQAEWEKDMQGMTMRLVLNEGRKRQIRRMTRELLGYHVVSLQRTRIGPIHLEDLPEGKWRPLTETEVGTILNLKNDGSE